MQIHSTGIGVATARIASLLTNEVNRLGVDETAESAGIILFVSAPATPERCCSSVDSESIALRGAPDPPRVVSGGNSEL
jgi:hypothetical protein